MLINDKLFIHIPKTGGTSMEYFLGLYNNYTHEYITNCIHSLEPNNILHLGYNQQHNPIHYYNNILYNINFIFTIVRNPYTRLLSAFSFFKKFIEPVKYKPESNLSISEWFFSERPINNNTILDYNNHLIPQYWYIQDKKFFSYICKYETLNQDVDYIKNKFGINIPFPHEFKTIEHHASINDIDIIIEEINNYYKEDFYFFQYEQKSNKLGLF